MRYSNLSNNIMISELSTTIRIQIQCVDGRAAHMTDTTWHQSWQSAPPPTRYHAGSIPASYCSMNVNIYLFILLGSRFGNYDFNNET